MSKALEISLKERKKVYTLRNTAFTYFQEGRSGYPGETKGPSTQYSVSESDQ